MAEPAWKRFARQLVRHPVKTLKRMDAFSLSRRNMRIKRADRAFTRGVAYPLTFLHGMLEFERRATEARGRRGTSRLPQPTK